MINDFNNILVAVKFNNRIIENNLNIIWVLFLLHVYKRKELLSNFIFDCNKGHSLNDVTYFTYGRYWSILWQT